MPSSRRTQTHEHNRNEIKAIAWRQLASVGPQAFSLGAVARALGVTPPALYRYFDNREDLLAELTRDAYLSFGAALEAARAGLAPSDYAGQFRTLGMTYYAWAIDHPHEYNLIFGPAVPGYLVGSTAGQAADQTFTVLLDSLAAAERDGKVAFSFENLAPSPELIAQLRAVEHRQGSYSEVVIYLAIAFWSLIHGLTSLDLSRRYARMLADKTPDLIRVEIERFLQSIGLT